MRMRVLLCVVVLATALHIRADGADAPALPQHPVGYVDPEHPYPKHQFHLVGEGKCELTGRVVDANGNGVAGAAVYFGNEAIKSTGMPLNSQDIGAATNKSSCVGTRPRITPHKLVVLEAVDLSREASWCLSQLS